jgi:Tfp pilus assembly protein PilE
MVQMLVANVGVLAIAALYYAWRDGYHRHRVAHARAVLRDRVAYMMWVSANRFA